MVATGRVRGKWSLRSWEPGVERTSGGGCAGITLNHTIHVSTLHIVHKQWIAHLEKVGLGAEAHNVEEDKGMTRMSLPIQCSLKAWGLSAHFKALTEGLKLEVRLN
jgi:hypothetical protein